MEPVKVREGGRRNRKRSAASRLLEEIAMTESVVMVKFDEDCDDKVYPINWDELLTLDEMPLTDVAQPGMKLLAPWRTNKKDKVKYAPARVCTGDNEGTLAHKQVKSPENSQSVADQQGGPSTPDGPKSGRRRKTCSTPKRKKPTPSTRKRRLEKNPKKDPKKLRVAVGKEQDKALLDVILKAQTANILNTEATGSRRPEFVNLSSEANVDLSSEANVDLSSEANVDLSSEANVDLFSEANVDLSSEANADLTSEANVDISSEANVDFAYEADVNLSTKGDCPHSTEDIVKIGNVGKIVCADEALQYDDSFSSTALNVSENSPTSAVMPSWSASGSFCHSPDMLSLPDMSIPYRRCSSLPNTLLPRTTYRPLFKPVYVPSVEEASVGSPSIVSSIANESLEDSSVYSVCEKLISPLKNQLEDVRTTLNLLVHGSGIPTPTSTLESTSSSHEEAAAPTAEQELQVAAEEEVSEMKGGAYLGYPNKDKYRVWVDGISPENISRAETRAMDCGGLGIQLLQLVFSNELDKPETVCCTPSKGRSLLNQEYLRGIRLHLHRRFLLKEKVKLFSPEEMSKWKEQLTPEIQFKYSLSQEQEKAVVANF